MKKLLAAFLACLLVLSLAACSSSTKETEAASTEAAATEAANAGTDTASDAGTTDPDAINAIVDALSVVEPEVLGTVTTLAEYTGIDLSAVAPVEISMEDAMDYLESYILPNYTEEVTDAIKDGDVANIDYEGKKDGVAFDGGTAEGYDLTIGSGSFIDGFESGLVGHKAGETVDLDLTFPENYGSEELAGQAVVFTVKINKVTRQKELTDALVPEINDSCKTVQDLKDMTIEYLQKQEDLNAKTELYASAAAAVLENSVVEPAQEAIDYMTNNYIKNDAASMAEYGIDLGTFLASYYGISYEEYRETYEEYSKETIEQRALLEEIAKKEGLSVTAEDIEAFAESYGYTAESIKEVLSDSMLNELVLEDLASQFIVDHANVTYEEEAAE